MGAVMEKFTLLDINENIIRQEWDAQVVHQTRPLPHELFWRSKTKVMEEIAKAFALEKTAEALHDAIENLERQLTSNCVVNIADFNPQVPDARTHLSKVEDPLAKQQLALGVSSLQNLNKLKKNHYLQV
ncbi:hypothetical protein BJ138DRAFT_1118326 [Hygrophoropsis aurantiaca]|uniref:Uncharacterized protein n=1 Tax=Hygrophoropsis aurantiaca TaxID=72124 RepID=A0ACB7ZY09_9AGAM|nr:hypothetical protein BJ138DRAFT_1118326 [Hygrophoropsis aurantiaca]